MKYKIVIFDFDGTLADTQDSILQTVKLTAKILNINNIYESEIKKLIGLPLKTTLKKILNLNDNTISEAIEIYRKHYNEIAENKVTLFKNVKETLSEIYKRKIKMAVASSKGKKSLINILNKHKIFDYFSFVAGEEDIKNKKPAPDIINLILKNLNYKPTECLFIGDTVYDIKTGQNAGIDTCSVSYGNNTKIELEKMNPNFIIDNFKQILNFI